VYAQRRKKQAYRQAPWRLQVRLTGTTALLVVALLVAAGLYLAVNSTVANAGRALLTLEAQRSNLERENAELMTIFAQTTSPDRLLERAISMGFRAANPGEIEYFAVPGFQPEEEFLAPQPAASSEDRPGGLSPAFTETLGEWLARMLGGEP
jgi:cell division protein FtsL